MSYEQDVMGNCFMCLLGWRETSNIHTYKCTPGTTGSTSCPKREAWTFYWCWVKLMTARALQDRSGEAVIRDHISACYTSYSSPAFGNNVTQHCKYFWHISPLILLLLAYISPMMLQKQHYFCRERVSVCWVCKRPNASSHSGIFLIRLKTKNPGYQQRKQPSACEPIKGKMLFFVKASGSERRKKTVVKAPLGRHCMCVRLSFFCFPHFVPWLHPLPLSCSVSVACALCGNHLALLSWSRTLHLFLAPYVWLSAFKSRSLNESHREHFPQPLSSHGEKTLTDQQQRGSSEIFYILEAYSGLCCFFCLVFLGVQFLNFLF